jgi:hypothetical protein
MSKPQLSPAPKIVHRSIAIGNFDVLEVEMALIAIGDQTGVVLREARRSPRRPGEVDLIGAFEYAASILRTELVYLRKVSGNLRFFHAQYEMRPTGVLNWAVQEVQIGEPGTRLAGAYWAAPDDATLMSLSEALSLWEAPQRTRL